MKSNIKNIMQNDVKKDINNENNLLCITEQIRNNLLSNTDITNIFYKTYYDNEYIKNEPTRYLTDVFSVGYNFNFIEETEIYPEFRYYINQKLYEKKAKRRIHHMKFGILSLILKNKH